MERPEIVMTNADLARLRRLLASSTDPRDLDAVELLGEEMARARAVLADEIPEDIVTMNSQVRYVDTTSGESRTVTVVYPEEADPRAGRVSVLAPIGCALLGLRVGQIIEWALPDGEVRSFLVEEVSYQPERAGELHR